MKLVETQMVFKYPNKFCIVKKKYLIRLVNYFVSDTEVSERNSLFVKSKLHEETASRVSSH